MSTSARRRLMRDFKVDHLHPQDQSDNMLTYLQRMQTDPPVGVSASPVADNVMTW